MVEEATENSGLVEPYAFCTERLLEGEVVTMPTLPVEEMKMVEVACAVPESLPTTKYPFVTGSVTTAPEEPMMEGAFEMERSPVAVSDEVATFCSVPLPDPYKRLPEVKVVAPVPPWPTPRVPVRRVMSVEVAAQTGAEPDQASTCPAVPVP